MEVRVQVTVVVARVEIVGRDKIEILVRRKKRRRIGLKMVKRRRLWCS